jgi:hypothetical protein
MHYFSCKFRSCQHRTTKQLCANYPVSAEHRCDGLTNDKKQKWQLENESALAPSAPRRFTQKDILNWILVVDDIL